MGYFPTPSDEPERPLTEYQEGVREAELAYDLDPLLEDRTYFEPLRGNAGFVDIQRCLEAEPAH